MPSYALGDSVQRPVWKPLHTTVQVLEASESQPIVTEGQPALRFGLQSPKGQQSAPGGWTEAKGELQLTASLPDPRASA